MIDATKQLEEFYPELFRNGAKLFVYESLVEASGHANNRKDILAVIKKARYHDPKTFHNGEYARRLTFRHVILEDFYRGFWGWGTDNTASIIGHLLNNSMRNSLGDGRLLYNILGVPNFFEDVREFAIWDYSLSKGGGLRIPQSISQSRLSLITS